MVSNENPEVKDLCVLIQVYMNSENFSYRRNLMDRRSQM
jgi:hypothetical protein